MADTPRHSVSVAGVVVREDGRVLVIRRRDNAQWEPPGGVLELDETFEQGVRREVLEETGVSVEVKRLTGVYQNLTRGIVALVFRCMPVAGEPTANTEAAAVRGLTLAQIDEHMDPAYAVRITDAFEDRVHVRAHDGVCLIRT